MFIIKNKFEYKCLYKNKISYEIKSFFYWIAIELFWTIISDCLTLIMLKI